MLSYLVNRHYASLTKILPEQLRKNQPKFIYVKNDKPLEVENIQSKTPKLKRKQSIRKLKYTENMSTQSQNWQKIDNNSCPVCLNKKNLEVKYYGKNHICVACRKFLRDEHGNQVKLFLNSTGDIVCLGAKIQAQQQISHENLMKTNMCTAIRTLTHIKLTTPRGKTLKAQENNKKKIYYQTDCTKLQIYGQKAYATFAGQDQLIVLLRKNQ